jgi:hypothetical protein
MSDPRVVAVGAESNIMHFHAPPHQPFFLFNWFLVAGCGQDSSCYKREQFWLGFLMEEGKWHAMKQLY